MACAFLRPGAERRHRHVHVLLAELLHIFDCSCVSSGDGAASALFEARQLAALRLEKAFSGDDYNYSALHKNINERTRCTCVSV